MRAIFKREIKSFFTSSMGYLVIGFFLVLNGLILWVFRGPYNIFDYGFADLRHFFMLTPWIFLILIPAIAMKTFSEEFNTGTMELLFIKPIPLWKTVLAKFFAVMSVTLIALAPSLLYVLCISQLAYAHHDLDTGVILGSYIGLLLIIAIYSAIGLFASSLTENQLVAFILGLVICFCLYSGIEGIASILEQGSVQLKFRELGMQLHLERITRGVLDSRDIIYFLGISAVFLYLTYVQLKYHSR